MLNVHLSYKPTISWRILFQSGGRPRYFSCPKKFSSLVIPRGGCHKGIIIQSIMLPTGVLTNGQSCLRIKGGITGASVHAPMYMNNTYGQAVYLQDQTNQTPSLTNLLVRKTPPGTRYMSLLHIVK